MKPMILALAALLTIASAAPSFAASESAKRWAWCHKYPGAVWCR